MRLTDANVAELVTAAQNGDRRALDRLITTHLPLVYNIVGRALDGHPDVDDVVQNTMLRAVRDLAALRTPGSFRSWLAAIAVRQVGTHQHRQQTVGRRTAALDEATDEPDPRVDVETETALRAQLSRQRREVAEATRWLDPGDRAVLALWWQEVAGLITRAELAAAAGLSVAHAGVRIQRMREQLDLARAIVAALDGGPSCPQLAALLSDWDGQRNPLWRKRITRHLRECGLCAATTGGRIPAERLLGSLPVLAVPGGLLEATLTKAAAAGIAGSVPAATAAAGAGIAKLIGAHPIAVAVAGLTAASAVAVPILTPDEPAGRAPSTIAAPATTTPAPRAVTSRPAPATSPSATSPTAGVTTAAPAATGPVRLGRVSLEWVGGGYLTSETITGVVAVTGVGPGSDAADRRAATFLAVAGLADPACYSFQALDGRYLRHYELEGYTNAFDYTEIFRQDATFCPRPGITADTVMLRSHNYPEFFLRWTGTGFGIGYTKDTDDFRRASSFRVRAPLAAT